jgi:hypothetical protein
VIGSVPAVRRKLSAGEFVIGFMRPNGSLIGHFAPLRMGHDAIADSYPGLRSELRLGRAIAITIGKHADGTIHVFGSGHFPPPAGVPLSAQLKALAAQLVE